MPPGFLVPVSFGKSASSKCDQLACCDWLIENVAHFILKSIEWSVHVFDLCFSSHAPPPLSFHHHLLLHFTSSLHFSSFCSLLCLWKPAHPLSLPFPSPDPLFALTSLKQPLFFSLLSLNFIPPLWCQHMPRRCQSLTMPHVCGLLLCAHLMAGV